MASNTSGNIPFQRSQSDNSNMNLMTHINNIPNFQRRTVLSTRQLRDNISNVIREIQPLVETARNSNVTISNFLNRPSQSEPNVSRTATNNDSFVINFDEPTVSNSVDVALPENNGNINQPTGNFTNNESASDGNSNSNNNNVSEENGDRTHMVEEAQQFLQVIMKYIPFILLILAKTAYDYNRGIFVLIILLTTFAHCNSTIKKEATKQHGRSLSKLSLELVYVAACLAFIHFAFRDEWSNVNIILHLIFISTFKYPLTVGYLLWVLTVTDFILKLMTVTLKILLTMLPGKIVSFKKRGKVYLFIESVSQLYRSLATVQPWLYYLVESYHGPEKIVSMFLSAIYMVSKGGDLLGRMKLLKTAFFKLLQNVAVGASPTKEDIQKAGEICPICHDEYDSPVLLHCQHIFCESCVTKWFDREQTCPLCRAKIVDDPSWKDGSTTYFIQIF